MRIGNVFYILNMFRSDLCYQDGGTGYKLAQKNLPLMIG
jgi:hypothetical protein